MKYTKKQILEMLKDESDDSIIVFEHDCKELTFSTKEVFAGSGEVHLDFK